MEELKKPNEKLMDLIFLGIDHGIDSVKDIGEMTAFVITETNEGRKLSRFITDTFEESLLRAREFVININPKPDLAIITYDGFITIEGEKYNSIIVNAFDNNENQGWSFAQRYKTKGFLKSFKEIGNVAFLGIEENLLKNNEE